MRITDEIREEHQHLKSGVEALREAGDAVGSGSMEAAEDRAYRALAFLRSSVIPHARQEDEHLYPVVAKIMGSPGATRTMSRDHVEVARLTHQLEWAVERGDPATIRRLLYGLYHLVRLHFAKEEEIYVPLLEQDIERAEREVLAHAADGG